MCLLQPTIVAQSVTVIATKGHGTPATWPSKKKPRTFVLQICRGLARLNANANGRIVFTEDIDGVFQ